ncbi:hypothetical protein MKX01_003396 [Papaver californicum]|nr:hypothetical protein MKX01_003396 [Papaver californicum]
MTFEDQSNSVMVTRAGKKRAAVQNIRPSVTKKRVVLGDITNLKCFEFGSGGGEDSDSDFDEEEFKKPIVPRVINRRKKIMGRKPEIDDPQMCVPYVSDICQYLHSMETEKKRRPKPDYIEKVQIDVTMTMRGILVDWLVEVAEEYKVVSETLYLAVSYVDRYLSSKSIHRHKLQLLGVTCMFIASKYEEISPPDLADFCYITDHTYSKEDIIKMESDILNSLKFEMGNPTTKTFLSRFAMVAQNNAKSKMVLENLGCYLAELSLLDYECIKFLPSMIAASVVFLSRFTIQPSAHPWSATLQSCSGYSAGDLKDCVLALQQVQLSKRCGSLSAIRDKYRQGKFNSVSKLISVAEIPLSYFKDVEVIEV